MLRSDRGDHQRTRQRDRHMTDGWRVVEPRQGRPRCPHHQRHAQTDCHSQPEHGRQLCGTHVAPLHGCHVQSQRGEDLGQQQQGHDHAEQPELGGIHPTIDNGQHGKRHELRGDLGNHHPASTTTHGVVQLGYCIRRITERPWIARCGHKCRARNAGRASALTCPVSTAVRTTTRQCHRASQSSYLRHTNGAHS